jgi:uncharacterized protein YlaI
MDIQDTYSIITQNETSIERATLESKKMRDCPIRKFISQHNS